ncbi:helix-turn-helix domain-containing protein [Adonisia turfae]
MTHKYQGAVKPQSQPRSVRHYRLTNDEWLKAVKELKPRERDVLYYLRTLDPWGDKDLVVGVREIATALECSPGTVSKALKVLDQKSWIDLEIIAAKVKLRTDKSKLDPLGLSNSKDVFPQGNSVASRKQLFPTENDRFPEETTVSSGKRSEAETHVQEGSQIALNSLKQSIPTTPSVCASENQKTNVKNSEAKPKVDDNSWLTSQVENAGYLNEAITSERDIYAPPILLAAKKKFEINLADPHLRRAIERWPERIEVAIACLEEKELTVKHPTRFLQKAIEEQWQPEALAKEKAPDEFQDWFKEARQRGLVVGSQRIDGMIMVYTIDERCVPFEQLRQLSWDALTAQLQAFPDDSPPVNTAPPEQTSAFVPEPEPLTMRHRVSHAVANQAPQLQADADHCHIEIPLLQAECESAAQPPGSVVDDIRRAR